MFSPKSFVALARVVTGSLIAGFLPTVNATFSIARCCTLAVRHEFHTHIEQLYPWEVCNFNTEIDYGNNETFPSIVRSMGWAKEFCRGTQYSSLKQWLIPLSTYISPYIGILLLCPVGDVSEHRLVKWPGWDVVNDVLNGLRKPLQEYISILGDPTSATFGALHEIWSDARTLSRLTRKNSGKLSRLRQRALWVAVLAGDIQFSAQTNWKSQVIPALEASGGALHRDLLSNNSGDSKGNDRKITSQEVDISPAKNESPSSAPQPLEYDASTEANKIDRAIEIVIVARNSFVGGVLIPVVLMLAVTAATFYDAYSKKGDKDTGLALAYCVWYSWILVLGVAGNCHASTLNPKVAKRAFEEVLTFGKEPVSTALRHRYVNSYLWQTWAKRSGDLSAYQSMMGPLKSDWHFWLRFCTGQSLGFCCVAFSSACAIAIAWTTPTVGLGCRSFNFILYVVLSFVTACMHVLCSWLSVRWEVQQPSSTVVTLLVARCTYWFLVFVNSLVVILGTLFHLVGVFRTCWCEQLTWTDSTLIELNSKTPEAVDNARRYWLSTAYIAFGVVWLACLTAIAFRRFIIQKMEDWVVESAESDES